MRESKQLIDTINKAMKQALSNVHTATIAKITKVNAKTIDCQPVINRVVNGASIELPEFIEVPPLFMQGGGSYTAHPIAKGDYCLLVITERCFDRWYHGQDNISPLEFRMHDYSDGIAIVGVNPLLAAITIPAVIQQTGDTNQDGDYTHQGSMTRVGKFDLTGNIIQVGNQNITGGVTISDTLNALGLVIGGKTGITTTFPTHDGRTVSVQNGIIWDVS